VAQILRNLEQQGQLTPGEEPMNEDLVRKKGSAAIIDAGQVALQKILMALSELGKPDGVS
jgi:hypothetical protein